MNTSNENEVIPIKDKLIDLIQNDPDLPTLGNAISEVIQLTSSDEQSLEQLSNFILLDPSLTLKILRLSNSITYRSSAMAVTSISAAIQLLGLNTIKACALAMIMVDRMPHKHAKAVRTELMLALSASLIGRSLAKRSAYPNADEVTIAALFRNIGRLIVAAYDDRLYHETMALAREKEYTEARASLQKLGCTFHWLTEYALRKWNIPDSIIQAMKLLPGKFLKSPKNRNEWMQQVTELSNHAALMAAPDTTAIQVPSTDDLLSRFGKALHLDAARLKALVEESSGQIQNVCSQISSLQVDDRIEEKSCYSETEADSETEFSNCRVFDTETVQQTEDCQRSGKPYNAADRLLTGIQEVSEMLASSQFNLSSLMMLVLETYYNSLGFKFVTICLKDVKTNQFRARNSLGFNHEKVRDNFVFPDIKSSDLFSMAIKRNVDLSISDATEPKIRNALPDWHTTLLPHTKSFILLPLVVQQDKPVGLIYADRSVIAHEGITTNEMRLIKSLKAQVLVALHDKR
ncbi:HD-like signal output (HDOD) domain, no enzymatic activity [Nitrosomonas sp. Nm51]|uniref:HDOD domain-containing protein n=1 Tax=Nitrosomonas sp. Nm51 TaxID=133720 RepID=UPI0008BB0816|nr:HDOD domain-containing protein [Nitrosomonas sp. Nm51]SER19826.1 HD-like signal output (HDOD) domain, no enzymatic activity [Nitrosomonas sp. Nm51]